MDNNQVMWKLYAALSWAEAMCPSDQLVFPRGISTTNQVDKPELGFCIVAGSHRPSETEISASGETMEPDLAAVGRIVAANNYRTELSFSFATIPLQRRNNGLRDERKQVTVSTVLGCKFPPIVVLILPFFLTASSHFYFLYSKTRIESHRSLFN